jgi:neutral ceramidase
MTVGRLKAGMAEMDITCRVGAKLAQELNPRTSTGIHTPLMAKALVLSNDIRTLALITLDLLGVSADAAEHVIAAVVDRCGLPEEAVMLVSSHTRGAPYTTDVVGWTSIDEVYTRELVEQVCDLVASAQANQEDAALGVGHATLPHLIYNHRLMTRNMKAVTAWLGIPKNEVLAPEGPIDPEFSVVVVRNHKGHPICLLWNFAADIRLQPDDRISAGLPGLVQEEVDRRLERHVPCLYLPGCGGNISYINDLEASVDAVASAIMAVQLETSCDPSIKLTSVSERMILPIRDYSQFWSRSDIAVKLPEAVETYAQEVAMLQQQGAHAVSTLMKAFQLGRFVLIGLPGIPFVEFALTIKAGSPFNWTIVAGNTGGYLGYVIPRAAFQHGGFETWPARSARIGPGGGEFMATEAMKCLQELWKQRTHGETR